MYKMSRLMYERCKGIMTDWDSIDKLCRRERLSGQ